MIHCIVRIPCAQIGTLCGYAAIAICTDGTTPFATMRRVMLSGGESRGEDARPMELRMRRTRSACSTVLWLRWLALRTAMQSLTTSSVTRRRR